MFTIKRYGSLWNIDDHGYFYSNLSQNQIHESPYKEVIAEVINSYLTYTPDKVHSIYVRGTVARGYAVRGISDFDVYAITQKEVNTPWSIQEQSRIQTLYPEIKQIQMDFVPMKYFEESDRIRFMRFVLKTQSVCIYGKDLSPTISPFRLSPEIVNFDISYLPIAIQKVRSTITESQLSSEDIKVECHHLMKKVVRTGLALIALTEQIYTRDLGLCYDAFVKCYPDQAFKMAKAIELAVHPIGEKNELLSYLNDFGLWMIDKCNDWLSTYNPEKDFEMKFRDK